MNSAGSDLVAIRKAFAGHRPKLADPGHYPRHKRASVALLLRDNGQGTEVLFIRRAEYDGDPWSGNIAFPGGHIETNDRDEQAAAERETGEELGIDLSESEYLGRLDDVAGAHLPVIVSCFAYAIPAQTHFFPSEEIVETFWRTTQEIADPQRQRIHTVVFRGEILERPAIDLLGPGETVLWGITYRLVSRFLQLLGLALPQTPIP